MTRFSD
jgi:hypothetical protein